MGKKKTIIVLWIVSLIIAVFVGCTPENSNIDTGNEENRTEVNYEELPAGFPRIDGSYRYETLIKHYVADLLEISVEEAEKYVQVSGYEKAYERLVNEEVDYIFVDFPDSDVVSVDEEFDGFSHALFCSDAIVFILNEKNTVKDLSREDVYKIYSGEIKNWKELGGQDEKIVPIVAEGDVQSFNVGIPRYYEIDEKSFNKYKSFDSAEAIVKEVGKQNGSGTIGFINYNAARSMGKDSGVIIPSYDGVFSSEESVKTRKYPNELGGYIVYLISRAEEPIMAGIREVTFTDAFQKIVEEAGYLPLDFDSYIN